MYFVGNAVIKMSSVILGRFRCPAALYIPKENKHMESRWYCHGGSLCIPDARKEREGARLNFLGGISTKIKTIRMALEYAFDQALKQEFILRGGGDI